MAGGGRERSPGASDLPTVLVLVLSIDREPWRTIELEGQRRTWASPGAVPDGCRVVYYYGRSGTAAQLARVVARLAKPRGPGTPARLTARVAGRVLERISERTAGAPSRLVADRLLTRVPDAYAFTLPKVLAALRWSTSGAAGSYDYVYRTNTSSYVNMERLRSAAAAMPRAGCYAGWIGRPPPSGPPFVKGAGILLSWDLARAIATQTRCWSWGATDDREIGRFLAEQDVTPFSMPRVLVRRPEDVRALPDEELLRIAHFRCKSHAGQRTDHLAMLAIHARLRSAGLA
jgi:hypothetical protein